MTCVGPGSKFQILFMPFLLSVLLISGCSTTALEKKQKRQAAINATRVGADHFLIAAGSKESIEVFDAHQDHKWVRSLPVPGLIRPRGLTLDPKSAIVFVSFEKSVVALNFFTGNILWRRNDLLTNPADRLDVTDDGKKLLVPSGFASVLPYWFVLDAKTGVDLGKIEVREGSQNTFISRKSGLAYLTSAKSDFLSVVDTRTLKVTRKIGPFRNSLRPFAIDADETHVFVNAHDFLGFQVANLKSGLIETTIEPLPAARRKGSHHLTPSHGIGLTPDESEIWLVDSEGDRLLVFSNAAGYPLKTTINVARDPGWINFDLTGQFAYSSTGEVFDVASKKKISILKSKDGKSFSSEQMLDVFIKDSRIIEAGSQFAMAR